MRVLIICLIGLLLNFFPAKNPVLGSDSEKKLTGGVEAFYQADWQTANEIFESLILEYPDNPEGYFFRSMIPYWSYFFAGEEPEDAETFLKHSERAVEIAKRKLEASPDDQRSVLMLSGLYGYRSLVAANEGNYRTAINSGTSGYRYSKKLMEMETDNPDALIGQGMFNYMIGSVPGALRWIGSLAGLDGDKEKGLELLEKAAESDATVSNDARMILTYLYLEEEKFEKALNAIEPLSKQYPDNEIFQYYYAKSLEFNGQEDEAKEVYEIVVDLENPKLENLREKSQERLENLMASL